MARSARTTGLARTSGPGLSECWGRGGLVAALKPPIDLRRLQRLRRRNVARSGASRPALTLCGTLRRESAATATVTRCRSSIVWVTYFTDRSSSTDLTN